MHERLWPDMDIPNTIVQNKRASIWLLDETSMTGDELWGDQTSRPLSVCMSYLLCAIRCKDRRPADRHHPMTAFKALIVRLCSTVGRMELSLLGLGCGYTKTFLVETDGKISGGAESVMSIDLGNHLEHYWNARRYSVAFPYLTSTFDDLTIWELVLFMLDRLVLGDFPDFEPAMVQFGFRLFSILSHHLESNLQKMCNTHGQSETLRRMRVEFHRSKKSEKRASFASQLKVGMALWDRVRWTDQPVPHLLHLTSNGFVMFFKLFIPTYC